jgi:hypothetical protein
MGGSALGVFRLLQQVRMSWAGDAVSRVGRAAERVRQEERLLLFERGEIGFRQQRANVRIGHHLFVEAIDNRADVGFASYLRVERIGTAN